MRRWCCSRGWGIRRGVGRWRGCWSCGWRRWWASIVGGIRNCGRQGTCSACCGIPEFGAGAGRCSGARMWPRCQGCLGIRQWCRRGWGLGPGTTVVCAGSGGVCCYPGAVSAALATRRLEHRVRQWGVADRRLACAQRNVHVPFPDHRPPGSHPGTATRHGGPAHEGPVQAPGPATPYRPLPTLLRPGPGPDPWDARDPVNLVLSSASTCPYGVIHSAPRRRSCHSHRRGAKWGYARRHGKPHVCACTR